MYREFELIGQIEALFPTPKGVILGIGDDCAVLERAAFDLVTTDSLVEGVHFRRDWSDPGDIGWKALARCLSDIAAMGGTPGAFFLNLVLGPSDDKAFVDMLLAGIKQAADELAPAGFGVSTAGGDVAQTSGPTMISITLLGRTAKLGPIVRSGASPGERVVLSGPTGMAAAAVDLLAGKLSADPKDYPSLLAAHRRPRPRVGLGALLGHHQIATAMIDISDGLGQDLGHILSRSEVGASLQVQDLPVHDELARLSVEAGVDVLPYVLGGGDDYELLMSVSPDRLGELFELGRANGCAMYDIGEVCAPGQGLRVLQVNGELLSAPAIRLGYEHFEAP
ncbi:MAG: thiamine-phosphate kinase [Bradymonadaceae bacterium]|nr:thiamine-phosphate kinase [Lujinxingiaceae bacterium]